MLTLLLANGGRFRATSKHEMGGSRALRGEGPPGGEPPGRPMSPGEITGGGSRATPTRLDRPFLPDAVLARLRHDEEGDQEHDRGKRDGIDQGPEEGVAGARLHRLGVGRWGDDGHETAAPAAADMIVH